ncbi:hypothetical protein [Micromonospora siamensis]|uniref:Uncharacterized protein n=1 Tax=Micromonospora siamensis TaxID=299152 RepID=A0A1C5JHM6_9ACTN|nr:hypothetical protein [Micromonospora siamensis]SCG69546.1 hypothetical protein GA0074704_4474 [Micromonospora siamensis]
MATFDEYAALAARLSGQLRSGERAAVEETRRLRGLEAAAGQLDQRLAAQAHRLDQLGRAIGVPMSDAPPPAPTAAPAHLPPHQLAPTDAGSAVPSAPGSAVPSAPGSAAPFGPGSAGPGSPAPAGAHSFFPAPGGGLGTGAGETGGAAAAPGRPGVGAYPMGTAGGGGPARPTTAATTAAVVPAQRPAPADPAAELAAVRQLADEADRHAQVTEAIGHQAVLLPAWSPPARALAVYSACALAGATLMLVMVVASGVGLVGGVTLGAFICAGLPVLSFLAGYLVLARFGRPPLAATPPPRYVPMGFVICVLLVPMLYCAYLLLVRFLR